MAVESAPCGGGDCRQRGRRRGHGEQLQPERLHSSARHGGTHFGVGDQGIAPAGKISISHLAHVIERGGESSEERSGGSGRSLCLGGGFSFFAQVEIKARGFCRLHALPSAFADCAVREAGRNHQRLLRAADDDVDAPGVDVETGGAEASDGIDDEQRIGLRFDELRNRLDVVAHAGGALRRLHINAADFGREFGADGIELKCFAIRSGQRLDAQPNALASEIQRSPNLPAVRIRTLSPGEVRFEMEASIKPVPEEVSTSTSFFVPMNSFSSASTRVNRARKSAVRWCMP